MTAMLERGESNRLPRGATAGLHPSASFSATLRVHLKNRPGSFAALANAIAGAGGLQLIEHRSVVQECFEPGRPFAQHESHGRSARGAFDQAGRSTAERAWAGLGS